MIAQQALEIYLVEDNPGDIRLTQEILAQSELPSSLRVAYDGEEAIAYLSALDETLDTDPLPDIILLDLNLPKKSGLEVLDVLKNDSLLKSIPVVILTSSESEVDVLNCYTKHANAFITKPVDFDQYTEVITNIQRFWSDVVELPVA